MVEKDFENIFVQRNLIIRCYDVSLSNDFFKSFLPKVSLCKRHFVYSTLDRLEKLAGFVLHQGVSKAKTVVSISLQVCVHLKVVGWYLILFLNHYR